MYTKKFVNKENNSYLISIHNGSTSGGCFAEKDFHIFNTCDISTDDEFSKHASLLATSKNIPKQTLKIVSTNLVEEQVTDLEIDMMDTSVYQCMREKGMFLYKNDCNIGVAVFKDGKLYDILVGIFENGEYDFEIISAYYSKDKPSRISMIVDCDFNKETQIFEQLNLSCDVSLKNHKCVSLVAEKNKRLDKDFEVLKYYKSYDNTKKENLEIAIFLQKRL